MRAQRPSSSHHRRRWPGLPRAAEHQRPHRPRRRDPGARSPPPTAPRWRPSPRANGLADADLILVGQRLAIPGPAASAAHHHLHGALGRHPRARSRPATARRWRRSCRRTGSTNPNLIRIGQVLKVPAGAGGTDACKAPAGGATTHVVRAGETLERDRVALRHHGGADRGGQRAHRRPHLRRPAAAPGAGGRHGPDQRPRTYVVRSGDTLSTIARRFGTTVRALQDANGIRDADLVTDRPHPQDPGGRHAAAAAPSDARCRAAPPS